jgi:hypothetical protein
MCVLEPSTNSPGSVSTLPFLQASSSSPPARQPSVHRQRRLFSPATVSSILVPDVKLACMPRSTAPRVSDFAALHLTSTPASSDLCRVSSAATRARPHTPSDVVSKDARPLLPQLSPSYQLQRWFMYSATL